MDFDEIDWLLVFVVVLSAIASLTKEVIEYIGIDTYNWLFILLKLISVILSIVFVIWKIIRLKPFSKIIELNEWTRNKEKQNYSYNILIPKSTHKKGNKPSVLVSGIKKNGDAEDLYLDQIIKENGDIMLSGNNLHDFDFKIRVVIKI